MSELASFKSDGFREQSDDERAPLNASKRRVSPAGNFATISDLSPSAFAPGDVFDELEIDYDIQNRALWVYMAPRGMPSFTPGLLDNLNRMHARLAASDEAPGVLAPLFFIGGSKVPGIFNLGGDLAHFVDCIREEKPAQLRQYARACVNAVHANATGFGAPIITIGLLEGNAFGGGFEAALSFHVTIAERGAKFGFPEVLFGSFPGMGAYSLVSRKVGMAKAEKMIRSGQIFTAEECHDMGLIDIIAEPGQGAVAVRNYIAENRHRHALNLAYNRVKQRMHPLLLDELYDITDIWVETAMATSASDLRRMARILAAQGRNHSGAG